GQRHAESRIRPVALAFLANLLAEHSRIVPGEAQVRVGGIAAQGPQGLRPAGIVVQKNVAFLALDQGQHIDVLTHCRSNPPLRNRRYQRYSFPCPASVKWSFQFSYRMGDHLHTTRVSPAPPRTLSISQMCRRQQNRMKSSLRRK